MNRPGQTQSMPAHWWQRDSVVALTLFIVVSSVYFATITGITSSNDGSHYAAVRAIVDAGQFEISPFFSYTENQDYAFVGDQYYSERPPATALLTVPLYALSRIAPEPRYQPPSKHDPDNPRMIYAVTSAALSASGMVALFYLILRRYFDVMQSTSLFSALALAFGTTTWKYGSVLFSHALSGFIILLGIYLVLEIEKRQSLHPMLTLAAGFVAGFSFLVEYSNALYAVIIGAYMLFISIRAIYFNSGASGIKKRDVPAGLAGFTAGALIPLIVILLYNNALFGSPFTLSYLHLDPVRWPGQETIGGNFSGSLWVGLPALLFYGVDIQGLFLLSPIALLGIPGLFTFFRYLRNHNRLPQGILIVGIFLAYVLLFSTSLYLNSYTKDGRYLSPFLGLWFIVMAFGVSKHNKLESSDLANLLLSLLVYALFFLSLRNQFFHIAFSWNYDLDLNLLRPFSIAPDNVRLVMNTVFRNWRNLPLLWAGEGIVAVLFYGGRYVLDRVQTSPQH